MLLRNATLADGSTADVTIDAVTVTAVRPGGGPSAETRAGGRKPDDVIDLDGHLLLPAFAEPHSHLDKALTVDDVDNSAGDLDGAIEAWLAHRPTITHEDYVDRATRAAERYLAAGVTALRTHVDIGVDIGTAAVEALLEVKASLADRMAIQLVGLATGLTGGDGAALRRLVGRALDLGLDVVGGVPHVEEDPAGAVEISLELAGEHGRPVDLHADENLDPASGDVETLATRILATGFEPAATASHAVALGVKAPAEQRRVAELVAEAGLSVVTLPQTNLYLQARGCHHSPPRGLTALAELDRAGVVVAAGGDNLRDPFCPLGRADPLEAAALLVLAGHRTVDWSLDAVSTQARRVMGGAGSAGRLVRSGTSADLVAIPAASVTEAVAAAPSGRLVIRAGSIVHDGRP